MDVLTIIKADWFAVAVMLIGVSFVTAAVIRARYSWQRGQQKPQPLESERTEPPASEIQALEYKAE